MDLSNVYYCLLLAAVLALLLWLAAFTALLVFLSFYCYSEFLLLFLTVPYLF